MRFQTLPECNCVTRLKLDPRRMARPASVISPQWSNPIVTRGLANLLLSCEMRSRSVDARVATTFPSGGRNTRKSTAYGCPRCTLIPSLSNLRAHFVDTLFSCYVQNESDSFINYLFRSTQWLVAREARDFSSINRCIHLTTKFILTLNIRNR